MPNLEKDKPKSIVLLSAGLDSTVNLYMALKTTTVVATLTYDYGQKAAVKELECASKISNGLKIPNTVITLPWLKSFGGSSLTGDEIEVPRGESVHIDDYQQSLITAKAVWVPNRNGIFLNIAAGLAESLKADYIIPGFNLEEAKTFPDNSADFVKTLDASLYFSTANHVKIKCYTINLSKTEIVKTGLELQVPFEDLWPCYFSGPKWCGQCESCKRSKRAFLANQLNIMKE